MHEEMRIVSGSYHTLALSCAAFEDVENFESVDQSDVELDRFIDRFPICVPLLFQHNRHSTDGLDVGVDARGVIGTVAWDAHDQLAPDLHPNVLVVPHQLGSPLIVVHVADCVDSHRLHQQRGQDDTLNWRDIEVDRHNHIHWTPQHNNHNDNHRVVISETVGLNRIVVFGLFDENQRRDGVERNSTCSHIAIQRDKVNHNTVVHTHLVAVLCQPISHQLCSVRHFPSPINRRTVAPLFVSMSCPLPIPAVLSRFSRYGIIPSVRVMGSTTAVVVFEKEKDAWRCAGGENGRKIGDAKIEISQALREQAILDSSRITHRIPNLFAKEQKKVQPTAFRYIKKKT
ncbi:hypothetical protein BLNAU_9031 [Blattamonas nauphoetae]|uniref:Uncharacterized protein n=1 Tax=Blattamonas nauphoetae TaxID=2049346 RepID=A0ABQ9XX46_9EUKA|nr:hypothetical protein BLNAU_9031 [Blattamonas nauphoetae]